MDSEVLLFFEKHAGALPIFEKFKNQVMETMDGVCMKVQKTQISFYNRHMFACVSFLRVRKAKDMPPDYIVVTFGLNRREDSPRIDAAVEAYPGRWTHHVVVASEDEVDHELMGWVREACDFSAVKRARR